MKHQFAENPFPDVHVSEVERLELIQLVDGYVDDYVKKYEEFVNVEKRKVDKRRWDRIKSKDNINVYTERTRKELKRMGIEPENSLSATQRLQAGTAAKDLPVMLSVGTLVGEMDDLMFGTVNPTLDNMRLKASYVHDVDSAAVLCSVVTPSKTDPYRSLVIKWASNNIPFQATSFVKSRDIVYIEATGTVFLENGERIGYHLMHSIDFPQTTPLPNKIRANLSAFACYRQIDRNVIDSFACATVDPGGDMMRKFVVSLAAGVMLCVTNYVYCGQMKKLAWLLQQQHPSYDSPAKKTENRKRCVVCTKKLSNVIGSIGKSSCKICYGSVCYSCKIRQNISFIVVGGKLVQRRVVVCAKCMGEATQWNAEEIARDQILVYEAYKSDDGCSYAACTVSSEMSFLESTTSVYGHESWQDI
ncbi:hypothetical protein PF005_g25334 [Phytophthora fragariae]|uniref:FYVE-type domain-containing protein n=1 Tax=Phytophthora fragariae TaxID=53985 RepID=A0A6A3QF06_9STRA|nr:hypothetical protein PF003_g13039 [Phytophthora fragariae]KAE8975448.1 hypothetical protein PF011_g24466 [Phytophthora fragariae]KAE9073890.1 hypothetical protein PF010_g24894 [Phytophthora fragariae]KAE9074309.1 hypothetical protein PF007_g25464 [Phytophthora fragariae]KAE9091885.1 hypothetical protein PF006_g24820 [Phytophthora fragariae]